MKRLNLKAKLVFIGLIIFGLFVKQDLYSQMTDSANGIPNQPDKITWESFLEKRGIPQDDTLEAVSAGEQARSEGQKDDGFVGKPKDKSLADPSPEYVPGQLIVKLKEGKSIEDIRDLNAKYNVTSSEKVFKEVVPPQEVLKELKEKLAKLGTEHDSWYWQLDKNSKEYKDYMAKLEEEKEALKKKIEAQEELVKRLEMRQKRAPEGTTTPELHNIYVLKTEEKINVFSMMEDYKSNSNIEYVEPNCIIKVQMVPNDSLYYDLWGLKSDKLNCESAWDISQGSGVIVAVVDTGIDYNHEDIKDNIYRDVNGNIIGFDFVNNDSDPIDDNGHGTHVAGTIAAVGNNSKGIIGVAYKAKIMGLKSMDQYGSGDSVTVANAIKYAADKGADVINNSLYGYGESVIFTTLINAVNYAYSKGCIVVAAAGNDNKNIFNAWPASIPCVITVAAYDETNQKCWFSNYGLKVDVAAPGSAILSLYPGDTYLKFSGTSMATPHVSGEAALVCALRPTFSNEEIKQVLRTSAKDIFDSSSGKYEGMDPYSGAGFINAAKAVTVSSILKVKISNSTYNIDLQEEYVSISGTAVGPGFKNYQLFYNTTDSDYNNWFWVPLNSSVSTPVENNMLAKWVINKDLPSGYYPVLLSATDTNDFSFQDVAVVELERERGAFKQITSSGSGKIDPAISGNNIVYSDTYNIFLYNLITNTSRQITTGKYFRFWPAISGNYIVWTDNRNGNFDIYLYDLTTNTERQITFDTNSQYRSVISGNYIVWMGNRNGNYDIYLYDLTTNTERQITFDPSEQSFPAISGNYIVWMDNRNGNFDISLYDLATETERRITSNLSGQAYPGITGNIVAWIDSRNGKEDIYLYDLTTNKERFVTSCSGINQFAKISSSGFIVWNNYIATTSPNSDICLYDLITNKQRRITVNSATQKYQSISDNNIVWVDNRNGNYEIYLLEFKINPPVLSPISNKTVAQNQLLKFEVNVTDPDKDILAYSVNNLPVGAQFVTVAGEAPAQAQIPGLYGDVNLDGQINVDDVNYLFNNIEVLSEIQKVIADVNGNGRADFNDTVVINEYVNDIRNFFPVIVRYGDVNLDGQINVDDVNYLFNNIEVLSELQKVIADVNGNGRADFNDAVVINDYVTGKISLFTTTTKRFFIWKPSSTQVGIYPNVTFKVTDGREIVSEAISISVIDDTAPTTPVVTDGGIYTSSKTSLYASWTSSDLESGIAQYQYKITQDSPIGAVIRNWTSTGVTPSVTATGLTLLQGKTYYFSVQSKNGADLWSVVGYSNGIKVDTTAPSKPVVTDGGASTINITSLTASWSSSDVESGIAQYQYKITQDSTTGAVIRAWTSTGTTPSVTASGLTLLRGKKYYFGVKSKNGAGTWSAIGYSDGILVQ